MRLFTAVLLPEDIRRELHAAALSLRRQCPGCGVTEPDNLHLTLAFIGETDRWRDAARAISSISLPAFSMTIGGCGRFGDLWWAGASSPELPALARAVRQALDAAGLPYDPKPFKPHITLARRVETREITQPELPSREIAVSRVSLMKSERVRGRLTYCELYGRCFATR